MIHTLNNIMRETRQLTIDDAKAIVDIYSYVQKFNFKSIPKEKYVLFTNINNVIKLLNEEGAVYFGTFDNDELIASLRMTFWKNIPHWSLGNLVTKIHTVSFNMQKNGLADCMNKAIELAESKGYYRFYTAISQRQMIKKLFDAWPKYIPALKEYLYVIEEELLEGKKSEFIPFEIMLNVARFQDPKLNYYIRSATANNNRRNFKILKELK